MWPFRRKPMTREAFAQMMCAEISAVDSQLQPQLNMAEFCILAAPSSVRLFLDNVYAEYNHARGRKARRDVIDRYLAVLQPALEGESVPDDFELVREHLLPRLRLRGYLEEIRMLQRERSPTAPEPTIELPSPIDLPAEFAVQLVFDTPNAILSPGMQHLQDWGRSLEEVATIALGNLRLRQTNPTQFHQMAPGLYISTWDDTYDASRLLYPDVIRRVPVKGRPVAVPFTRNDLLLTGDDDSAGLEALTKSLLDHLDEPRFESAIPLVLNEDDGWERLRLPDTHPASAALSELIFLTEAREYDAQRERLEKWTEHQGEDVYVAQFSGAKGADGRVFSWCSWAYDVPSLLPRTDTIAVQTEPMDDAGEADTVLVRWTDVEQLAGELLQRLDYTPTRYRVERSPRGEVLRQLRERALD